MINVHYNRFRRLCASVLGLVFLMSGILKLMDPTGSEMMMRAYYNFMHLGILNWSAKAAGTVFSFIEAVTGAALVTGVWRKITGITACALTAFFTLLTLVLVIFDPPMDCGCFGEAVHLTHLQTFLKNIALCALCCLAFIPMRDLGTPRKTKYVSFAVCVCSVAVFMTYSLVSLPLKEFTDFETGAVIAAAAKDNASEAYNSVFVYEKDGKREQFALENLPDSSWMFVETVTASIDDGFPANPVFSITDAEGQYCDSLAAEGQVLVISLYKKAGSRKMDRIREFTGKAESAGVKVLVVSSDDQTQYHSDFKTLATLNRSNGGAVLLNGGMITAKWPYRAMAGARDSIKALDKYLEAAQADPDELAASSQTKGSLAMQGFLLYVFAVILLL